MENKEEDIALEESDGFKGEAKEDSEDEDYTIDNPTLFHTLRRASCFSLNTFSSQYPDQVFEILKPHIEAKL
jgi:hypothetical protein